MKMKHRVTLALSIVLLMMGIVSCSTTSYVKHSFGEMQSYHDINGIYADSTYFVASLMRVGSWHGGYEGDSINIYKFEMVDANTLNLYGYTSDDFLLIKQFKGKYNTEKQYFETTVYSTVIPIILFTIVGKEKIKIGKTTDNHLLVNYEQTDLQMFLIMGGGNVEKRDKALPPVEVSSLPAQQTAALK